MICKNIDGSKTAKVGHALIHLDDLPGGVCAWTDGALRPTFVLHRGQHVQIAQFNDAAAADAYLRDQPAWEVVARIDATEEGQ